MLQMHILVRKGESLTNDLSGLSFGSTLGSLSKDEGKGNENATKQSV